MLTKGCMLANDGSDDSVDADPFARSKKEMAVQTKQSEAFSNQLKDGGGELTVGKTRSSVLCLLAEQDTCVPAL